MEHRSRGAILLMGAWGFLLQVTIERAPLDQRWEQMMIEGRYGWVELNRGEEGAPFRSARDLIEQQIRSASGTKYGIRVNDSGKPTFFGLIPRGHWWLKGGLLGRVERPTEWVELFGKAAEKISPWGTVDLSQDLWADFFLVRRPKAGGPATIVRKWSFKPGEIAVTYTTYPHHPYPEHNLGGTLHYDEAAQEVEVTLHGLTQPVVERVPLPPEQSAPSQ